MIDVSMGPGVLSVLIAIPLVFLAVFFVFLVKEQRDSEQSALETSWT